MTRLLLLVFLLCAVRGQAQAPIVCHGCPDRTVYASRAEWPKDSFQCHWSAKGANLQGDRKDLLGFNPKGTILDPAHVHLELTSPRYGDITGPWQIDFTIVLRDLSGVFALWGAEPFKDQNPADKGSDWWFDDTHSSTPPSMVGGDPAKAVAMTDAFGRTTIVQTYTGHFTAHPRLGLYTASDFHGWDAIAMSGTVYFANGDSMIVSASTPYFNNIDPTAPITMGSQGPVDRPFITASCAPIARGSDDNFGENFVFVSNYLPTRPLAGKWSVPPNDGERSVGFTEAPVSFSNSYGGLSLLNTKGSNQTRHDVNFHMGIPGVIVQEVDAPGIIPALTTIDNTGLPVGPHNWALSRSQPENSIDTNGVVSLLVIQVPVPDGTVIVDPPPVFVPPPVVCVPPAMLMNGQCLTPPPPPAPAPIPTLSTIKMCAVETFSDGSVKNRCLDLP